MFTSALILALPPVFERELQEMANMEQQEQRKVRRRVSLCLNYVMFYA